MGLGLAFAGIRLGSGQDGIGLEFGLDQLFGAIYDGTDGHGEFARVRSAHLLLNFAETMATDPVAIGTINLDQHRPTSA